MAKEKKKSFSVGGLGGPGTTGALFEGDVLGEALDKANPWLDNSANEMQDRADQAALDARDEWKNIVPYDPSGVQLDDFQWLGDLEAGPDVEYDEIDARLAQANTVDGTAFDDIEGDPRLKEQQMASLGALNELVEGGGFNAADRANLSRISSGAAAEDKGRRGAILQSMQQRGMGGSGMELLAQLDSSQAATDRAAQEGLDIAGLAQDRALQAMMQGSSLAGDIRGQDFSEGAARAEAFDAIQKFNAGTLNDNSQFNAGAANQTNQFNAGNKLETGIFNKTNTLNTAKFNNEGRQGTADKNTTLGNTAKVELPQQAFDNKLAVTGGKANAGLNYAGTLQAGADKKNTEIGQKKQGAMTVAGALMSDEREKKDVSSISDDELTEFFEAASGGKKYKYKDTSKPGTAEGVRIGIMAQDVEGTDLGKHVVKDTEDGKMLDMENVIGLILASLANKKGK
jgi:hypothetical protein